MELTVGMATYRDFDGVYFTVQALRLYQDMDGVELLVVDNFGCEATRSLRRGTGTRPIRPGSARSRHVRSPRPRFSRGGRRVPSSASTATSFSSAACSRRLKQFYREHPDCLDLLAGAAGRRRSRERFHPFRSGLARPDVGDLGPRSEALEGPDAEPFDIPMQGLGLFSCRKTAWPGFHPGFRGFGGEEGYIHEKFRQLRRTLPVPALAALASPVRPARGRPLPVAHALTGSPTT